MSNTIETPLVYIRDLGITEDGTFLMSRDGHAYPVELKSGYIVAVRATGEGQFAPSGLFGRWTDQETGIVYWDEVEHFDANHGYEALSTAQERGELAIWDCAENKEIRV